jgi:general secretion pathway protein D
MLLKIMKSTNPTSTSTLIHSTPNWTPQASFIFGLCALMGILMLIFSEVGFAQGNPIGAPGLGAPVAGYDDEEDFEDFDEDYIEPIRTTNRPNIGNNPGANSNGANPNNSASGAEPGSSGITVGGSYENKPGPDLSRGQNGITVSGPGTEKGIKSKNTLDPLTVDNESGDGIPASTEQITDFNFPDADILDIAKTMGRLTGKNFLLDKDVKGRVSVISNGPITVSDAWRAFLTALDMNQLAIVPAGKFLRIMRQNDAKGKNVRMYSNRSAPNTDALVTKIFKIKYISAKELENVVRTYANMGARIYGFEQTNTLIITDTGSNIDKIARMIDFLDVEGFDAGIEVIQVRHASAVELQKLIDTLLPGTQANFPGRPGVAPGGGGRFGGNFSSRRTKQGGLINTIIADERTNSLIVHANTKGVEQVRELLGRLDRKMPMAVGGGKVHVLYLQFADAEEMSKTLTNFSQNTGSKSPGGGFNPGAVGGLGVNPNEGNLFENQIKISPDKTTNSLVITASPNDYQTLQRVINKLDIPRDQVYVEVVIMEMAMQRSNEFAANLLMPGKGASISPTNDLANLLKDPTSATKGLILQWQDSGKTNFTIPGAGGAATTVSVPNSAALVKALQGYANANVLATPQLMTMDNAEAVFESTDKIPTPRVNNAGLGIQQVSIDYQNVPLTIKIKPQLNKISNFIKLDIKARISDIQSRNVPKSLEDSAIATLERNVETSVNVADTDTVVLGGLTRDKSTENINKVPLLGDIPILGWLFKSRNAIVEKTNLMLFITPKIIRQYESIRHVLDQKLKERDEFVERAMGGEDIHREQRNKMIRSLPDIKAITNYNAKKVMNMDDEITPGVPSAQPSRETLTIPAPDAAPPAPPSLPANAIEGENG